jgi:hypothetical protein
VETWNSRVNSGYQDEVIDAPLCHFSRDLGHDDAALLMLNKLRSFRPHWVDREHCTGHELHVKRHDAILPQSLIPFNASRDTEP